MLQNELSCLLMLLFVSPLLCWSLWARPKQVVSAFLSVPYREHPLPQELSLLSAGESVCAPRCNAAWTLVLGPRCGPGELSPYSLKFEFFAIRGLCSHDLVLNMKNSIFSVQLLDKSLAQGRTQLEPFGLTGVVIFAKHR